MRQTRLLEHIGDAAPVDGLLLGSRSGAATSTSSADSLDKLKGKRRTRDAAQRDAAETTALGAAYAAGLAVGFWSALGDLRANWASDREWRPAMDPARREKEYGLWKKAVTKTFDWAE